MEVPYVDDDNDVTIFEKIMQNSADGTIDESDDYQNIFPKNNRVNNLKQQY